MASGLDHKGWDYSADYYLLKHTIDILRGRCTKLLAPRKNEIGNCDRQSVEAKNGQSSFLEKQSNSLEMAETELALIREMMSTSDSMETTIAASKLQLDRLQEEHDWLKEEEEYFEKKMEQEMAQCDRLRKTIDHVAFIFNGRREWNGHGLPTSVYGLPSEKDQTKMNESPLLKYFTNKLGSTSVGMRFEDPEQCLTPAASCGKEPLTIGEDGDRPKISVDNTMETSDLNTSNSGSMSLTELKNLLLREKSDEAKKLKLLRSIKKKPGILQSKNKPPQKTKPLVLDAVLSESDKLVITEYVRNKMPSIYGTTRKEVGEEFNSLEKILENFVRSKSRCSNMNALIQLINHFTYSESNSPGISLGWMAISALKRYEKELRRADSSDQDEQKSKHQAPNLKHIKSTSAENQHKQVIEDIGHLLTLLGLHYKSRNELQKSMECFKEILKIWRTSKSSMETSIANTFHHLSVVQALANDQTGAIASARKAIRLRKDLLESDMLVVDTTTEQLSIARESTHLALLIMHRQQNEQKKIRYRRLQFKDAEEVPTLLTKAISLVTSLAHVYANSLSLIADDWDRSTAEASPSTLGDSTDTFPRKHYLNSVDECWFIAQNALAIHHIQAKKWQKSMRLLQTNLTRMDQVMPDSNLQHFAKSKRTIARTIKLTCLKSLLYVLHMLEPSVKQDVLFERIRVLDRYYREGDEITESDMIRMCQTCLFGTIS